MPKGIMVVRSAPSDPAREDEYNDWYSGTHLSEVSAIPGFGAARRYKLHGGAGADDQVNGYLAIYEIEADDLSVCIEELRVRSASGEIRMSDVLRMDPPPEVAIYELIE